MPAQKSVDLFIQKRFPIGRFEWGLFINVYNVFDIHDDTWVWTDTGSADYTTTITPGRIPYNPLRVGTVENYVINPGWYSSPRWTQAGISLDF